MRKTLSAPALATAAKGTRRPRVVRAAGESRFRRGISAFNPRATLQEAPTASKYEVASSEVLSGLDLFALAELIATLRD